MGNGSKFDRFESSGQTLREDNRGFESLEAEKRFHNLKTL